MDYHAVIFDLDGTLLDTLADIANSANRVLRERGFPPHEVDAYRYFIGDGVHRLFSRVLPTEHRKPDAIVQCVEAFRETYGRHWNVRTKPYDGIPELLDAVAARGLKTAVLSNKPHDLTARCVDEYFSRWRFHAALGQREGIPPKPDPAGAREITERLGVPPERFLYLGDTGVDMMTARNAGMDPVGALWGFRSLEELREGGARAVIRRPTELLNLLDGSMPR